HTLSLHDALPIFGHATGDHDIGALAQRLHHGPRAEVGVGGAHAVANVAERAARVEVVQLVSTCEQPVEATEEVVSRHDADAQLAAEPQPACRRGHRL